MAYRRHPGSAVGPRPSSEKVQEFTITKSNRSMWVALQLPPQVKDRVNPRVKGKVKSDGQECPSPTGQRTVPLVGQGPSFARPARVGTPASVFPQLWVRRVENQVLVGCGGFVLTEIGKDGHPASVRHWGRAHDDGGPAGNFSDELREVHARC